MDGRSPVEAWAFDNGMLVVFDAEGNQVPPYQGKTVECLPRLRRDYPEVRVLEQRWCERQPDPW